HAARGAAVAAVGAIALTVSDMDRSVAFYTSVLEFRQVADTVVTGDGYGRLEGVPGSRVRVVRLQLGDETLQLMAWLHPTGRPAPTGAHSNDRWFQHVAIIVSDMARAYAVLEAHGVERVSPAPQRLPDCDPGARLRITRLRAAAGPGIEFLEYLSPRDGRPALPDERANDLVHWQTMTASANLDLLASRLTAASVRFVSPGVVEVDDRALGFVR